MTVTRLPIACDRAAIPLAERPAHTDAARRLFGDPPAIERLHDADREGWRVRFDAGAFDDVVRWVRVERLCCPFLRFAVEVDPDGGAVTLTLTGPIGTIAFLEQEIL